MTHGRHTDIDTPSTVGAEVAVAYDADLGHLVTLIQNPTANTGSGDSKTITYTYASAGDVPRLDEIQYPTGSFEVGVKYGDAANDFSDLFNRPTRLEWNGHQTGSGPHKAAYTYLGLATPVIKKFPFTNTGSGKAIQLDYYNDPNDATPTAATYFGLDRFGRATRNRWIPSSSFDPTTNAEMVDWEYVYDHDVNTLVPIARIDRRGSEQTTYTDHQLGDDWSYTHDGLYRVTQAMHGTANSSFVVNTDYAADSGKWTLDHLGNWSAFALDLTEDGDFLDTGESVDREHNFANELTEIDSADVLTYDAAGNLISREIGSTLWEYEYDAWNRLTRVYVTAPSDSKKARARFHYNALNQRVLREVDTDGNGVFDLKTRFYYDAGWRIVEEHADTDANEDASYDAASILQRVWGPMGSDEMLYYQRDTDADDDTDDCYYALHDALGSVVALLDHVGTIKERVSYTPYGDLMVESIILGDVNGSGTVNAADFTAWNTKNSCVMGTDACYDIRYDFNLDGVIGIADYTILAGNFGKSAAAVPAGAMSGIGNTIGYAGYVWDPALGGAASGQFLVRHRWYSPNLGRWTSRDPIGYRDSINLYLYVHASPVFLTDPSGLGVLKWIYTGDWNASDEVYDAATDAAGSWLNDNSPVRGAYVAGGWTMQKGKQGKNAQPNCLAGIAGGWTMDSGAFVEGGVSIGGKSGGRDSNTGMFTSDDWGIYGGGSWSEAGGWGVATGIAGAQSFPKGKQYRGGGHGGINSTGSDVAINLGLQYGPIAFGIVIDPSKVPNYIKSVCGCGSSTGKSSE